MSEAYSALSRESGLPLVDLPGYLCVDTYKDTPLDMAQWSELNPFHVFDVPVIPVPGGKQWARSVESVWQGSKVVDGKTAEEMFLTSPWKRPADKERTGNYVYSDSQFQFSGRTLDVIDARYLIYLPAYLYVVDVLLPAPVFERLVDAPASGIRVVFIDWDSNMDIDDPHSSFSHSSILAAYFGGRLEPFLERQAEVASRHASKKMAPLLRYRSASATRGST